MKISSSMKSNLGILPPWEQEKVEIQAIRNLPEFEGKRIRSIDKIPNTNSYLITFESGAQRKVNIIYLPSGIGPKKFELYLEPVFIQDSSTASLRRLRTETR